MFYHQKKDLIIPQRFHGRFAGLLASFWGNELFSLPPIPKESFVLGISDHDRGYDEFDSIDFIGLEKDNVNKEKQRKIFYENSLSNKNNDNIANNISLTHVKYMCHEFPKYQQQIDQTIESNNKEQINYEQVQTITLFLDNIAFNASLGREIRKELEVESFINGLIKVSYSIQGSTISISPRPFSIPTFDAMLYGCEQKNYPEKINISGILYTIKKEI